MELDSALCFELVGPFRGTGNEQEHNLFYVVTSLVH